MVLRFARRTLLFSLGILACTALPVAAQQASTAPKPAAGEKVVQVTGLAGIKQGTKGSLTLENGNLQFDGAGAKVALPINTVEDVVTENDSQRVFRGTIGTLTMFAPYGGGRFLSLFRSKIDTLTIQYRDADGGLHGAIFTMALGKSDPFKKEMLSQGAHTTIPLQDAAASSAAKADAAKEKQ
jgi:hypothetical protein